MAILINSLKNNSHTFSPSHIFPPISRKMLKLWVSGTRAVITGVSVSDNHVSLKHKSSMLSSIIKSRFMEYFFLTDRALIWETFLWYRCSDHVERNVRTNIVSEILLWIIFFSVINSIFLTVWEIYVKSVEYPTHVPEKPFLNELVQVKSETSYFE